MGDQHQSTTRLGFAQAKIDPSISRMLFNLCVVNHESSNKINLPQLNKS